MPESLGYLLTWTTYGTWLPGDARGWVDKHDASYYAPPKAPDPVRERQARARMSGPEVLLTPAMREIVERAVLDEAAFRGWTVHAVSARSNHVHVVITAPSTRSGTARGRLKACCSRRLNAMPGQAPRRHWWTEDGSGRYLHTEASLRAAIRYVQGQDVSWMKHL